MPQIPSHKPAVRRFVGILLAAGRGSRFDPSGVQNKLLQPLVSGGSVAITTAESLLKVLPDVMAVVRPGVEQLAERLRAVGCKVSFCPTADQGMAASLVHGLSHTRDAEGWLIALADMPYVRTSTIQALVAAVEDGAQVAVATYQGRRGNPIVFSRTCLQALLTLHGDEGARRLLKTFPVKEIATDDPGICRDIDYADDLRAEALSRS
jgi:molybdenum cofactor cytidylyltransferase